MSGIDFDEFEHHFECSRCGKEFEGKGYALHYEFMRHVWDHEDEEEALEKANNVTQRKLHDIGK